MSPLLLWPGSSIASHAALKEHVASKPLQAREWPDWLCYDGTALSDAREATRDDFDKDFPSTPLVLVHVFRSRLRG